MTGSTSSHILESLFGEPQKRMRHLRHLAAESAPALLRTCLTILLRGREDGLGRAVLALLRTRGLLPGVLSRLRELDPGAAASAKHISQRLGPLRPASGEAAVCPELDDGILEQLAETAGHLLWMLLLDCVPVEERSTMARSRLARTAAHAAGMMPLYERLRRDSDPRVRADAVEGLWGQKTEFAVKEFRSAAEDPHHRVAACGWVGLHMAGAPDAAAGLLEMAAHPDTRFRAAAAWAMGRTGDPKFKTALEQIRAGERRDFRLLFRAAHALARITPAPDEGKADSPAA
jgi:hypothetical protein